MRQWATDSYEYIIGAAIVLGVVLGTMVLGIAVFIWMVEGL